MPDPFPVESLRTVVRWIIEWALEPGEAASGKLEIHIITPEKKKPEPPLPDESQT